MYAHKSTGFHIVFVGVLQHQTNRQSFPHFPLFCKFSMFSLLASPFFSPIHSVCIFAIFLSIFYFFLGFFATPVQIDSFRGTRLAITSKRWIVWRVRVANWLQKWFLQQFWRVGMSTAGPLGSPMAVSIHHCSLKSPSNPYFVRKFNKIHFNRLLNMLTEHMNISF